MRIGLLGDRRVTTADVLVVVAGLAVVAALLLPTVRRQAFDARLTGTATAVADVRRAALDYVRTAGSWPEAAPPGEVPSQLVGLVDPDVRFVGAGRTLQWTRWNVVDSVVTRLPAPESAPGDAPSPEALVRMVPVVATVGAVRVHSTDADLLGELLQRFGREASFVHDTTWTLVLPRRARREGP